MLRRMKKRFLDWPLAQKFVFVFSLMTLLSGALMVGALHLGLSVFEEKFYEKSLQELDFFLQRVDGDIQEVDTLTRSIAVDSAVQQQLGELAAADLLPADGGAPAAAGKALPEPPAQQHPVHRPVRPHPDHRRRNAGPRPRAWRADGGFAGAKGRRLCPAAAGGRRLSLPALRACHSAEQERQPGPAGHRDRRPGRGRAAGRRDRQPVHPAE